MESLDCDHLRAKPGMRRPGRSLGEQGDRVDLGALTIVYTNDIHKSLKQVIQLQENI